jgi:hypothetical protein
LNDSLSLSFSYFLRYGLNPGNGTWFSVNCTVLIAGTRCLQYLSNTAHPFSLKLIGYENLILFHPRQKTAAGRCFAGPY